MRVRWIDTSPVFRIPDDISVAGFNDTIGEVLHPGLTTVREFPKELGGHPAEFTLRRIHEPDSPPPAARDAD